jgi:hypothetical protein
MQAQVQMNRQAFQVLMSQNLAKNCRRLTDWLAFYRQGALFASAEIHAALQRTNQENENDRKSLDCA